MIKLLSNPNSNENQILSLSLDEIARVGAKKLLAEALQLEVEEYIQKFKDEGDVKSGKRLVVKNGSSRERKVTTGAGTLKITAPRINDKRLFQVFLGKMQENFLQARFQL